MSPRVQGVSIDASTSKLELSPTDKSPSGSDDSLSKTCNKKGHTGWENKCPECLKELDADIKQKFVDADKRERLDNINRWLRRTSAKEKR